MRGTDCMSGRAENEGEVSGAAACADRRSGDNVARTLSGVQLFQTSRGSLSFCSISNVRSRRDGLSAPRRCVSSTSPGRFYNKPTLKVYPTRRNSIFCQAPGLGPAAPLRIEVSGEWHLCGKGGSVTGRRASVGGRGL